ncbi:hypothetical protein, partial [uncultured Selenomonas sp.]|uniref:hypothetical protein n=1 Tax=uncultured Selenomonas sp. TaxID=159275 RepID=UPI00258838CA
AIAPRGKRSPQKLLVAPLLGWIRLHLSAHIYNTTKSRRIPVYFLEFVPDFSEFSDNGWI